MPKLRIASISLASPTPKLRVASISMSGDGVGVTNPKLRVASISMTGASAGLDAPKLRIAGISMAGGASFAPKLRVASISLSGSPGGATPKLRIAGISFSGSVSQGPALTLSTTDNECFAGQQTDCTAYAQPNAESDVDHYIWSVLSNSTGRPAVLLPAGNSPSNVATLWCPISTTGGTVVVQCIAVGTNGQSSAPKTVAYTVFPASRFLRVAGGAVIPVAAFRKGSP